MKKTLCLLFCLIIFCSGCSKKSSGVTAVTSGLSFDAEIIHSKQTENCFVEISSDGKTDMALTVNESMELDLSFEGNKLNIKLDEIEYKTNISALPKSSVIDFIYTVFSTAEKTNVTNEGESLVLKGKTEKYNYKIYLGETGLPLKIEDKENNITVKIKNVTLS